MKHSNCRICSFLLSLVLVFGLFSSLCFAEEPADGEEKVSLDNARDLSIPEPELSVIDEEEFQDLISEFISHYRVRPKEISIGFYYSGTGEFAYYNENMWYYSASLFKVPMVMSLMDRIYEGTLTWDAPLGGLTFEERAYKALVYSHNPSAYQILGKYWSSEVAARKQWMALADMGSKEFPRSYLNSSYFNAPFITRVMVNLLKNSEFYADVIADLKQAQPGQYFKTNLEDEYEIAQKYGSWGQFKHTSGIVYTENPIVITIMTSNASNENYLAGELAEELVKYTREKLDPALQKLQSGESAG